MDLLSMNMDLSGVNGIGAENGTGHFCTPGTHQAGKTEYFASLQIKTDIFDMIATVKMLNFKGLFLAGVFRDFRRLFIDGAADHHGDDVVDGHRIDVDGVDVAAADLPWWRRPRRLRRQLIGTLVFVAFASVARRPGLPLTPATAYGKYVVRSAARCGRVG